jgi:hypothetical protein
MSDRQSNGGLFDREIVLTMPARLAESALGRAVAALLQAKRWGMWRADGAPQPLAAEVERLGGRAAGAGCHVVTFQRRRLGVEDVKRVVGGRGMGGVRARGPARRRAGRRRGSYRPCDLPRAAGGGCQSKGPLFLPLHRSPPYPAPPPRSQPNPT